jgi:hypothetical protein
LDELRQLRQRLNTPKKKLDIWVVLYEKQLGSAPAEYLKLCDIVQLWTWSGHNLDQLPSNFEKAEKLCAGSRMAVGMYWWDFGSQKPLALSLMKRQCELGLQLLRQGRIEAIIFCGSWCVDRDLETVAWTRKWIEDVGEEKLPGRRPA